MTVDGKAARAVVLEGEYRISGEKISSSALRGKTTIMAVGGQLRVIKDYPVEDYVAAVLQGETAGQMPAEALKALAVAIRSYATRFRERHKEEGFDFCDTTHCQFLKQEVSPTVAMAVQQTAGEMLWDHGMALPAYYHEDCGGRTEAAGTVWPDQRSTELVSVADSYCVRNTQVWKSEIPREDLARALWESGIRLPAFTTVSITERTPTGRAAMLRVGPEQVSASSLRFAVGRAMGWQVLKSDWYEVQSQGDRFVFSGKGVGHGVGLCQTGAAEMAAEGKSYREILAFYYASAPIGKSAQGIPWITTQNAGFTLRFVRAGDSNGVAEAMRGAIANAERATGLKAPPGIVVEIFPSIQMYRDATGEPGWVAASTLGQTIRLEPVSVLGSRLGAVLRHEVLHLVMESNAGTKTSLWFREGLVLQLGGEVVGTASSASSVSGAEIDHVLRERSDQASTKRAYTAAQARVAALERRYGRAALMKFLREGLPANVSNGDFVARPEKVSQ
jgi:stage II sporulation protein D